jgi:hypothetical protein
VADDEGNAQRRAAAAVADAAVGVLELMEPDPQRLIDVMKDLATLQGADI